MAMWREAVVRLESSDPPIEGELPVPIALRSREAIAVNLLRPYQAHQERFPHSRAISWMDRTNPNRLTELLPFAFLAIWIAALLFAWIWYLA
jgi:hypothetical protein